MNDNYWNILKQINDHQLEAEKIEFIESLPTEKIKIKSKDGENLLHALINNSSINTLIVLINRGLDINNTNSSSGRNLLFKTEDPKTIEFLLTNGAEINHQDSDGWTPLIYHLNNDELIRLLLENGANTSLKTKSEHTFLQEIIINVDDTQITPKLKLVKYKGVGFEEIDPNGFNLIHFSILYQKPRALQFLLQNNGNVNTLTKNEFHISKGEDKILLPKNSSPMDLCNVLIEWANTRASDSIGGEWVYEQKLGIYTCLLILKDELDFKEAIGKAKQLIDNK